MAEGPKTGLLQRCTRRGVHWRAQFAQQKQRIDDTAVGSAKRAPGKDGAPPCAPFRGALNKREAGEGGGARPSISGQGAPRSSGRSARARSGHSTSGRKDRRGRGRGSLRVAPRPGCPRNRLDDRTRGSRGCNSRFAAEKAALAP